MLNKLPIGVLNFSIDKIHNKNFKLKYNLKLFANQNGYKKNYSYLGKLISENSNVRGHQKLYSEDHLSSSSENKSLYSIEPSQNIIRKESSSCLSHLITFPKQRGKKQVFTELPNNIFIKTFQNNRDVLVPFFSQVLPQNLVKTAYDRDNFLKYARISLSQDIDLNLQRLSYSEFLDVKDSLETHPFNLRWLKNLNSIDKELIQFQSIIGIYLQKISKLTQFIVRKMPELPYFTHRQLIFLSNFCSSLKKTLGRYKKHRGNIEVTLNSISEQLQEFLSELGHEPNQFLDISDLKTFSNQKDGHFLLPRIISSFLEKSTDEIQEYLNLEKTIKTRVRIALNIDEYPYKAVFRSYIQVLENFYQINLKPKTNSKAQFSLAMLEETKESAINSLCKKQNGKIDIEIGTEFLEDSYESKGSYHMLAHGFYKLKKGVLKVLSNHYCHDLSFITKYELNDSTIKKFDTYKKIIIQPEQELKLSNRTTKHVRLSPGKYVMFVNSTKTGNLISKEVFTIPEAKKVRVAANIKLSDNRFVR
jgi:hypothetical protein